ncbi:uncharacterized protein LOC109429708 [Aedes albopictus]|uniref:ZAD domain-containing protein n=1 Tax=Aedes albopictus TaxID=7160 RepID=A0ABM1XM54_AEDAL|nr:uncharacterized protein LOC109416784 [Aedes albopictus]
MESDNNNSQIVCRFCLQYSSQMWPLETVYNREKSFLEKVYQCAHINIIDLDELRTWVCGGCLDSIERFYSFRNMLQRNLTDFNERFREEQKEHQQHESDWNDSQQVELLYSDFSDCEDCYEIPPTDSEYDTETDVGVRDRKPDDYVRKGSYEAAEIEAEFAEIISEESTGPLDKFEMPPIGRREEVAPSCSPSKRSR